MRDDEAAHIYSLLLTGPRSMSFYNGREATAIITLMVMALREFCSTPNVKLNPNAVKILRPQTSKQKTASRPNFQNLPTLNPEHPKLYVLNPEPLNP